MQGFLAIILTAYWASAVPTMLPPPTITSMGPATGTRPLLKNARLQRRRPTRHDWNEDEEDEQENDEQEWPMERVQEEDPREDMWWMQRPAPPVEEDEAEFAQDVPTVQVASNDEEYFDEPVRVKAAAAPVDEDDGADDEDDEAEAADATAASTPSNSVPIATPVAPAPVTPPAPAPAPSTTPIVEDTTPVTAATFQSTMRQGIDYSKVPAIAPKPVGSGVCPGSACAPGDCERCWETCGNCPRKDDYYGCKDKNAWALTFDDGPSPHTARLLDALKAKGVKATFFVMGGQAAKYPQMIKRMFEEGHDVASHTWSHPHLMSLTDDQVVAEIKQTEDTIFNLIGQRPRYIRPPYGEADDRVKAIFQAHGLQPVMWNMDTLDWSVVNENKDIKEIVNAFQKVVTSGASALNPFNNPGFISLQHDIYLKSVEQETDIIDLLRGKGLMLQTVSQCTGDKQPYLNSKMVPESSTPASPPPTKQFHDVKQPITGSIVADANVDGASTSTSSTLHASPLLLLPLLLNIY